MATQVQFRGGSSSEHSSFTGAAREVTVDTTKNALVVHDGSTPGGHPVAPANSPDFTGDVDVSGSLTAEGRLNVTTPSTGGDYTVYFKNEDAGGTRQNAFAFTNDGKLDFFAGTASASSTIQIDSVSGNGRFNGSITAAGNASFAGGEVTINTTGAAAGKVNIDNTLDGGNSAWGLSVKNNDSRDGRPTLKLQNVGGGTVVEINNADASAKTIIMTTEGDASFSGTVTATVVPPSDARFKENISPAHPQLADVVALGGILKNYDWNEDAPVNEALRSYRQLGLIAQEAEEICPTITKEIARTKQGKMLTPERVVPAVTEEAVDEEGRTTTVIVTPEKIIPATYEELDDSYKGITTDVLIMKLLGAVAELSAEVEALKKA